MAGTVVPAMPTIPATAARDLPLGVNAADVLWDETIGAGGYAHRTLRRGARLRITDLQGDACINYLVFNADRPIERLNVADTVKVQWNAYLGKGRLLLSDMGRVLMSILDDTSGRHDTFCGCSNASGNARKYGNGLNSGPSPSGHDRFLIALAKHGLGRKDVVACVNFFKGVRIEPDGSTTLHGSPQRAGAYVELRAEMNSLVVFANTPHVLDPRPTYTATPARFTAWRGPVTSADDPIRNSTPEALRAFQSVEDYFLV
jgi:urea carboxylase-associated protein 2